MSKIFSNEEVNELIKATHEAQKALIVAEKAIDSINNFFVTGSTLKSERKAWADCHSCNGKTLHAWCGCNPKCEAFWCLTHGCEEGQAEFNHSGVEWLEKKETD